MNFIKLIFIMLNKKYVLVEKASLEELGAQMISSKASLDHISRTLYVYYNALMIACDGDEEKANGIFNKSLGETIVKNDAGEIERVNIIMSDNITDNLRDYYNQLLEKS